MILIVAVAIAAIILASAFWVVTLRNLFRAALSLGLVLIGVAGLFILLEAEFLAFVQILIYVGAVLTLVVFAIMLTSKLHADAATATNHNSFLAASVSIGLFILLVTTTSSVQWPTNTSGEPIEAAALGKQFVTTLVLPFEVISLIFVAALVGAVAIALGARQRSSG